jgi:hypothetical protein
MRIASSGTVCPAGTDCCYVRGGGRNAQCCDPNTQHCCGNSAQKWCLFFWNQTCSGFTCLSPTTSTTTTATTTTTTSAPVNCSSSPVSCPEPQRIRCEGICYDANDGSCGGFSCRSSLKRGFNARSSHSDVTHDEARRLQHNQLHTAAGSTARKWRAVSQQVAVFKAGQATHATGADEARSNHDVAIMHC